METLKKMLQSAFVAVILFAPTSQSIAGVAVGISINVAPPELPVYDQPVCPGPTICGPPVTGRMVMKDIIGFREFGFWPHSRAFFGRPGIGGGRTDIMFGMMDTGAGMSDFMAGSAMDTAIRESVFMEDIGAMGSIIIIVP